MPANQDEQIRVRAYELWERDGRRDGRAEDYWHQAALDVLSAQVKKPAKRTASATPRRRAAKAA